MKIFATLSVALLLLFALASTPAFSQEREDRPAQAQPRDRDKDKGPAKNDDKTMKQDENRTKQDEGKRDEAHPEGRQNDNNVRPDADRNNNSRPAATRPQEENRHEQRPDQHIDRDRQQQRPVQAQRGKRIPDDRFRSSFGREHRFHVDRTRIVNVSQPVVVYAGYSFELVDAWPADWSYDDDCYIDYVDDGYYLFDVRHPGMRIAVFVIE
jgi:hypothetical protein